MTTFPKVLFICTGNYYRSRYAEIMFNHFAALKDLSWHAFSRGFASSNRPHPISLNARLALEQSNIPLIGAFRFPIKLNPKDLEAASKIIVLYREEHFSMMASEYPQWLNTATFWQVPDIDVMEPKKALPIIDQQVNELITDLTAGQVQFGT